MRLMFFVLLSLTTCRLSFMPKDGESYYVSNHSPEAVRILGKVIEAYEEEVLSKVMSYEVKYIFAYEVPEGSHYEIALDVIECRKAWRVTTVGCPPLPFSCIFTIIDVTWKYKQFEKCKAMF